jgi:hypothetical protein
MDEFGINLDFLNPTSNAPHLWSFGPKIPRLLAGWREMPQQKVQ